MPPLFYLPKKHTKVTEELLKKSQSDCQGTYVCTYVCVGESTESDCTIYVCAIVIIWVKPETAYVWMVPKRNLLNNFWEMHTYVCMVYYLVKFKSVHPKPKIVLYRVRT